MKVPTYTKLIPKGAAIPNISYPAYPVIPSTFFSQNARAQDHGKLLEDCGFHGLSEQLKRIHLDRLRVEEIGDEVVFPGIDPAE